MISASIIGILALGLCAGLLIGCIGIGGVILVPVLVYVAGIPITTAIAAALMSFVLSGVVAAWYLWREAGNEQGQAVLGWSQWAWAGAMPAALLGAWATNIAPQLVLELAIGGLVLAGGIQSLGKTADADGGGEAPDPPKISSTTMTAVGAFTGFGSAITGTGGPLILVPIMMWLRLPVIAAIRLGQAIQLPIATIATIGNLIYGNPDITLGLLLAAGVTAGTWIGAKLPSKIPRQLLRKLVSVSLLGIGTLVILKVALQGAAFLAL